MAETQTPWWFIKCANCRQPKNPNMFERTFNGFVRSDTCNDCVPIVEARRRKVGSRMYRNMPDATVAS